MPRSTYAQIDLDAVLYNFKSMSLLAPHSKQVVVVKADAYGNGAIQIAKHLESRVSLFAVAFLDEVYELRKAGIKTPILVLQGPHEECECALTDQLGVVWMLHTERQLEWLDHHIAQGLVDNSNHWLKFDTGMHRLGLMPERFIDLEKRYPRLFHPSSVIATHLSAADTPQTPSIGLQFSRFDNMLSQSVRKYPISIANSAANIHLSKARQHWNRMGISLYGSTPFENQEVMTDLKPVMSLHSQVIAVRTLKQGESVGYGDTWIAKKETRIATVALGYADGYPRHAPIGTPALFDGKRAGLVGRVSMDMLTFDVSHLDTVSLDTQVELWGQRLPINEIAKHVGTIGYELMTRVSSRVPRRYTKSNQ